MTRDEDGGSAEVLQAFADIEDPRRRSCPYPLDELLLVALAAVTSGADDFEGGGRVLMEFTDTDADELRVGLPLRMVYRIKDFDRQRGFRRYFWKATPVRGAAADGGASAGTGKGDI